MRKLLVGILLFAGLTGCVQSRLGVDEKTGRQMLVGPCTRQSFADTAYASWWNQEYDAYRVDTVALAPVKHFIREFQITVVMATWCSDSRREIPRLFKILDYAGYPSDSVRIIGVDRNRKGKADEVQDMDIKLVPTIIFSRQNVELFRIIETPKESLEKDMAMMM